MEQHPITWHELRRGLPLLLVFMTLFTSCSAQGGNGSDHRRQAYVAADNKLKEAAAAGVDALCALLHDPHFAKRHMAAYELGSMDLDAAVAMEDAGRAGRRPTHPNGPKALDCLLRAVNDTSEIVRGFTATALGNFPDQRVDAALKEQLAREQAPEVRKRLLHAIGNQLEKDNGAFLSNQPAPSLADSMGIVLGAKELAVSGIGSATLVERCLPMYPSPALQGMVIDLLARTDTATLTSHVDELLAVARSQRGRSEQSAWCRVIARIPGMSAEAYLKDVLAEGLTPKDRETARALLARRQRER